MVTDVRMPGMDGIELQRSIRLQRPKLPVIFISAHQDDETLTRALEGGAVRFLYKPFDGAELLTEVWQMPESRQRHGQFAAHTRLVFQLGLSGGEAQLNRQSQP